MLFPYTESRQIELRPAGVKDAAKVYDILFRLGHSGLPVIDRFVDTFGQGLSACFLVHRKDTGEVVGFSTLSELAPAGHLKADVHLAGQPDEIRMDVVALTVNFAFAMWRTRKVYFHATDPGIENLGFAEPHALMVEAEAVLPRHTYFHGQVLDVHVFAIYREAWDVHGVDLLKHIV
ncbi:GNAT family N-acetyltransferase [Streptosporangium amethystogenes subsp. fukuiense]|uniref:GNAT family N-acetyltransferase n=1 Tax=Streptosporangium amethystogenes subsp. fukuiense TaxID=698418 RepID=A0ABW2TAS2_9ACTN